MSAIWSARGTGEAADCDLGIEITHEPDHTLDVTVWNEEDGESGLNIDRDEALALYHALGDWLIATGPETPDAAAVTQVTL